MTRDIIMGYLIFGEIIALGTVFVPRFRRRLKNVPAIATIISVIALVVGWPAFVIFGLMRR